jgi:hypothetical protein
MHETAASEFYYISPSYFILGKDAEEQRGRAKVESYKG